MTTNTRKAPIIIIAATTGLAAGALATSGVFLATVDDQPADECMTALEQADRAMWLYSDTLTLTADTLEAYEANDYRTMDQYTAAIRYNNDELIPLVDDYETTKTQCLEVTTQ